MCETSKSPAACRVARCSSTTDVYQTGMSQPANGTILAPMDLCVSCNAVNLTGSSCSLHWKDGNGSFWNSELIPIKYGLSSLTASPRPGKARFTNAFFVWLTANG